MPLGTADEAGRRAKAIEAYVATLEAARSQAEGSLSQREALARGIRDLPTSKDWVRLGIADRIARLQSKIRSEHRDEAIRAIASSAETP